MVKESLRIHRIYLHRQ